MSTRPYTLITGAAGRIGTVVTKGLSNEGHQLILADLKEPENIPHACRFVKLNINEYDKLFKLCQQAHTIIHLAGHPNSREWEVINEVNIKGTWCVFDAAINAGVQKIIYASSIHVAGYRPADNKLPADAELLPDGLYGLSKCFGELLLKYYSSRFGVSALALRICSFKPEPLNKRDLSTWISHNDMSRLMLASLLWNGTGYRDVWGISNNSSMNVDTACWQEIGYEPKDSADDFATTVSEQEWDYLGGHVLDYKHIFGDGTTD